MAAAALECLSGRPSSEEEMSERMLMKTHYRSDAAFRRPFAGIPSNQPAMWWQRLGRNFAGALAVFKSSGDGGAASSSSSSRGNDRLFWGSFIRDVTKLYPGSQLPERLISNFRSHFDSLPNSYSQAGFDMKEVLLHVRLIEQASSEEIPAIHVEEDDDAVAVAGDGDGSSAALKLTFASTCSISWPAISAALGDFSICCSRIQIFEKKGLTVGVVRVLAGPGSEMRNFKARAEASLRAAVKRPRFAGAGVKLRPFGLCGCHDESSMIDEDEDDEDDDDEDGEIELLPSPLPETSFVVSVDERQRILSGGEEIRRWLLSSDEVEELSIAGGEQLGSFPGSFKGRKVWIEKVKGCEKGIPYEVELRQDLLHLMCSGHRNVLQLVGFVVDGEHGFCVVTKMMDGGSVWDSIGRKGKMGFRETARIAMDVAEGLAFFNGHGVAYRDLNTQRILLDRRGNACLGGGGGVWSYSCRSSGEAMAYETAGFRWLAPEIIAGDPESVRETAMSNVYSFGMVVWEMLAGEAAYGSCSPVQAAVGIAACGLRPRVSKEWPPLLSSMMIRCWNSSPSKRPQLPEIISILKNYCDR